MAIMFVVWLRFGHALRLQYSLQAIIAALPHWVSGCELCVGFDFCHGGNLFFVVAVLSMAHSSFRWCGCLPGGAAVSPVVRRIISVATQSFL